MHFRITLALLGSLFGSILSATALEVTHGPMLGRPGATSMGVWARTATAGEFYVRYGTGAGDLDLATAMVTTKLENDCTGWIELKGLKPATRYHFAVVTKGQKNPPPKGTFRTLQSSKSVKDPKLNPKGLFNFSFEFACGNNQSPANGIGYSLPTYTTMLREVEDSTIPEVQRTNLDSVCGLMSPPAETLIRRARSRARSRRSTTAASSPRWDGAWPSFRWTTAEQDAH